MEKINLQGRLGITMLVFFLLGVIFSIVSSIVIADKKVMDEVASISDLVNRMFSIAELGVESPFNPDTEPAFLRELIALENIRHIDIRIQSTRADYPQINETALSNIEAPGWFIALVYPENEIEIRTFMQSNGDIISIFTDPGDEVEEIWQETRDRLLAAFTFLLVLAVTLMLLVRYWMKPLDSIADVLDNVEQGDFSRRIHRLSLPELQVIGDHINRLTGSLGSANSENERLTRKSITVQEQERRYLAQELHDSLGQAVSAIKAIAVSIADRTQKTEPRSAKSAENIEEIADSAYKSVRSLMSSLRPPVLDELGVNAALEQMIDDWNVHHEDTFCRLRMEDDYSNLLEEQQINIYRIVQEGLTNISKYASAENISITLSGNEIISLLIVDDGVGFNIGEITQNMGLMGIRDRVTMLQGQIEIASKPGKGVSIQIEFPRQTRYRRRAGDR